MKSNKMEEGLTPLSTRKAGLANANPPIKEELTRNDKKYEEWGCRDLNPDLGAPNAR